MINREISGLFQGKYEVEYDQDTRTLIVNYVAKGGAELLCYQAGLNGDYLDELKQVICDNELKQMKFVNRENLFKAIANQDEAMLRVPTWHRDDDWVLKLGIFRVSYEEGVIKIEGLNGYEIYSATISSILQKQAYRCIVSIFPLWRIDIV